MIPALLFPALFALLPSVYPTASGEEGEHTYPFSRIPLFLWCGCLLTAFSESAYYNLYGALEPVMPGPSLSVLVLVVLGGLSALLVLGQAHRSPIWYAFLLVIPVLVVGYTCLLYTASSHCTLWRGVIMYRTVRPPKRMTRATMARSSGLNTLSRQSE